MCKLDLSVAKDGETNLGVEEPKQNRRGYKKTSPDVDGLDAPIGGVGADHVRR